MPSHRGDSQLPPIEEYAQQDRSKKLRCWVCRHPEREAIEEAMRTHGVALVVRWLRDGGYTEVSEMRLRGHVQRGHA